MVRGDRKPRVHFGYCVVAALVITSFIPLSFAISCSGIFYPYIAEELGIEKGMTSYYISFVWISTMLSLPFMGKLLDKGDARVCLTLSVGTMVVAFVWLSFTASLWQFYLGGFIMGIGVGSLLYLAPSTLMNRWFVRRAGFFLGVIMAFTGVGGVVWSSVGGILIEAFGWSATYRVFAVLVACTLPVTLFLVASRPQDKGLLPCRGKEVSEGGAAGKEAVANEAAAKGSATKSATAKEAAAKGASAIDAVAVREESVPATVPGASAAGVAARDAVTVQIAGVSASQAFKMPVFYCIAALGFCLNFGMYVYIMIPSYASTLGIGIVFPLLGATAGSVAMAGQTIFKLGAGSVGEKHPAATVIVALCCGLAGLALFSFCAESMIGYYIGAGGFGLYYGVTNVMLPILARRSFGDAEYAVIYSKISIVSAVSNVVAALILGTLIDATGSYLSMFGCVAVVLCVSAALTVVICRSKPTWEA